MYLVMSLIILVLSLVILVLSIKIKKNEFDILELRKKDESNGT